MIAEAEPQDDYVYRWVHFKVESVDLFIAALRYYEARLDESLGQLREDEELRLLLPEAVIESFPIHGFRLRAQNVREYLEQQRPRDPEWDCDVTLSHGWVRYIRSVLLLFLAHLRHCRDAFASRPRVARSVVDAVDQQLARIAELTRMGVFANASPSPWVDHGIDEQVRIPGPTTECPALPTQRPIAVGTVQVRDPELQRRCLDLLMQFSESREHDRLDQIVNEASRILEDRLRKLSAAPATCIGVDLASHAFGSDHPCLTVSAVAAEQEGAHLMFRGYFRFVRNSAHHRLLGEMDPDRVLQVVAMTDWLVFVAETAMRVQPSEPSEP